jgi:outer membrane protein insertion porin family
MTSLKRLARGVFVALALLAAVPAMSMAPFAGAAVAQEQRLVSAVLFTGNQGFSDAQLLAMVNVGERGTFSEDSLAADAESIRLAYVEKGYMGVTVTPRVEDAGNGRSRVTFDVNEGQRTGIAAINFTGNNSINAGTLKSVIRTRESHLLSWLFRDDTYTETNLAIDRELIRLYYANHGYPDTVVNAVAEFDPSRNAYFLNFDIVEGDRYSFGEIGIETSIAGLNTNALASTIRTGEGQRYSFSDLSESQQDMAFEATSQGYAFADVRPRVDRDPVNKVFNITYLVDDGARIYVERINITGNFKTRDYVIRRELDFGEGDPFNRSMVDRGKSNIEALGFFSMVDVNYSPGSAADKVIIDIIVEEQSTGDYGVTAGYSTEDGVLGELSVTERNFLGRGQFVRASIGASEGGTSFDFSFTEPRFMGLRVSSGFDFYHRISTESSGNIYGTTATGGQVRIGLPVTRDLSATLFTGAETKTVEDLDPAFSAVVMDGDVFNKAWVGATLTYNTLDNEKRPTEGLLATATSQYIYWDLTGDFSGVGFSNNLLKTEARARYFMPLLEDWNVIGSVRGVAGNITGLDGGGVHPLEAFRLGPNIVRGFESRGIGPRLGTGELLGSTSYVGASAEIEFPIPVLPESYGIRGAVWADAALVDGQGQGPAPVSGTDTPLRASVGASVIWDSPFGPLRGDFAHVLSKSTGDRTQVFQFSIQQLL